MQTMNKGKLGCKIAVLAGSLFGGIFVSQAAMATVNPGTSARSLFSVSEVSDAELSQMRGKFVERGKVVYFGVEMVSTWVTANNEQFSGNINLSLSGDNRRFVPTITYKVNRTKRMPKVGFEPQSVSAGGLDDAEGITQSIQVAGAANQVRNEISITIDKSGSTSSFPSESISQGADDGQYVTRALNSSEGLALEFDIPGQGRVTQSISGQQGLKQQVQLTSNFNNVVNSMNIVARLDQLQSLNVSGVRSALRNINTLQGIGRF